MKDYRNILRGFFWTDLLVSLYSFLCSAFRIGFINTGLSPMLFGALMLLLGMVALLVTYKRLFMNLTLKTLVWSYVILILLTTVYPLVVKTSASTGKLQAIPFDSLLCLFLGVLFFFMTRASNEYKDFLLGGWLYLLFGLGVRICRQACYSSSYLLGLSLAQNAQIATLVILCIIPFYLLVRKNIITISSGQLIAFISLYIISLCVQASWISKLSLHSSEATSDNVWLSAPAISYDLVWFFLVLFLNRLRRKQTSSCGA